MNFTRSGIFGSLISETQDRVHHLAVIEYIRRNKNLDNLSMDKAVYGFDNDLKDDIKQSSKGLSLRTTYRLKLVDRYFFIIDAILSVVGVSMFVFTLMNFNSNDGNWAIGTAIISLGDIAISVLVSKIRKELF
jgi:hypothetical protein